MKKISKEIQISLVVIGAVIILVAGANFLKGRSLFGLDRRYYVVYDQVDHLNPSSAIFYKGLKVGQVESILFMPERANQILVEILINEKIDLPNNTVAEIFAADLMGTRAIELIPGTSGKAWQPGDTLVASIRVDLMTSLGSQVGPLMGKVESLAGRLDTLAAGLNAILNAESQASLRRSILALEQSLLQVKDLARSANKLVSQQSEPISAMIGNLRRISDSLDKADLGSTIAALNRTLDGTDRLMKSLNDGEGTAGKLIKDKKLYDELNASAEALKKLLIDLQANPRRYVHFSLFGKKDKTVDSTKVKK